MRDWTGIGLGVVLVISWIVAFVVMRVSGSAIHLLLLAAFGALAVHLLRDGARSESES